VIYADRVVLSTAEDCSGLDMWFGLRRQEVHDYGGRVCLEKQGGGRILLRLF
jgi:hypothetical protein